jgi:hypothetical protein
MEFFTTIQIPRSDTPITHSSRILLIGSCFTENIGNQLLQNKFNVEENPFGILYNPFSISRTLRRLLSAVPFDESELIYHNGMYHSLLHHGDFSAIHKCDSLQKINERLHRAATSIRQTTHFLITFGTAGVYRWNETGEIVGNCHQLPASRFTHLRVSVEEIVADWSELIQSILQENRQAQFQFTVSPIRHWRDGARENQLSKSTLHLAIDTLQRCFPENVGYFPAYEIMMDELRDYRFYASDMMHPSPTAIAYIWKRFSETFFPGETLRIMKEWSAITNGLAHRPLHPGTAAHREFLTQLSLKLERFITSYPEISCEVERELLLKNLCEL